MFIFRWLNSLQVTKVTRWGGMISTPDACLQTVIKRALSETGCPSHILGQLMENSHERRWPPGLSTLEARQINRRNYENYVCKRIPGMTYSITFIKHLGIAYSESCESRMVSFNHAN